MHTEPWRLFWAKTNREKIEGLPDDWIHPLWAHLIDVGSAAQVLWERFLPASLKQKMADGIGMPPDETGRFLSVWIGLHDLGKGIPSFQGIENNGIYAAPTVVEKLTNAGLTINPDANRLHHGHASIAIALRWLHPDLNTNRSGAVVNYLLDALAACVGIHHGKLVQEKCWVSVARDIDNPKAVLGNALWRQAQQDIANAVFDAWGATWPTERHRLAFNSRLGKGWPDWLMAFAGWATLADWLGSMQGCFSTGTQPTDDLKAYLAISSKGAKNAFKMAGLDQRGKLRKRSFKAHFGFEPRELQKIARKIPLHKTEPNLLIVEAPTGEGKTEAAFYLAARFGRGVYAAMPSQATSNGLFPRLEAFVGGDSEKGLLAAHDGPTAALRLVHGNDLLREDALSMLKIDQHPLQLADDDDNRRVLEAEATGRVLSWFMPKKRALLVPYGVGTVDQLFLGVLYTKHFFLRLFALCGKTIVFDEVHAYDTYMNTIFERLLAWLRALDVNVVVLSATLPAEARQRMLSAWGSNALTDGKPAPYPVAWQAAAGQVTPRAFLPDPDRGQHLHIDWCDPGIGALAAKTKDLLERNATVIVICNKVERAQDLFALFDDDAVLPAEDRLLLHARMPQEWRKEREEAALTRFGKGRPNRRGLLVGTQVIEQSLDLDADSMITDLAPIDLLLQRAGRLHRHQRTERPAGFTDPVFIVACPNADDDDLPDVDELSGGGKIYARKLLWQTHDVLKHYGGWALPLGSVSLPGYRTLIDSVYTPTFVFKHPLNAMAQARYGEAKDWLVKKADDQEENARKRLVPKPNELQKLFTYDEPELAEEDDSGSGQLPDHLRAFTRDPDGLSAEVLLLHPTADGWSQDPGGETLIKRGKMAYLTPDRLRSIFGAAVRISHAGVVSELFQNPHSDWVKQQAQNRVLKRFHLIELTNYVATVGTTRLVLDKRLGVRYPKE